MITMIKFHLTIFLQNFLRNISTRSSAVAAIADRTTYDVLYIYRPLAGIAMVIGQHKNLL